MKFLQLCYNINGDKMKDYAIIGHAYHKTVRIYAATTKQLVQEAQSIHQSWPTASAALGRLLTAGAMMGLMYKDGERITLRIQGDGPIKYMIAEANGRGQVRADIGNPEVYIKYETGPKAGKLNVSQAVGNGFLYITKDLLMKNYYTSSSELVSGEIAEDFTYYFTKSEQTNSSVGLGVLVNPDTTIQSSGGYILQLMPGASEETVDSLEKIIQGLPSMTSHFNAGKTPEDLFEMLSDDTGEILKKINLEYHCPCSYEGFLNSLNALSVETLTPLVEEDHGAHIKCHFCHKEYHISEDDLTSLIKEKTT